MLLILFYLFHTTLFYCAVYAVIHRMDYYNDVLSAYSTCSLLICYFIGQKRLCDVRQVVWKSVFQVFRWFLVYRTMACSVESSLTLITSPVRSVFKALHHKINISFLYYFGLAYVNNPSKVTTTSRNEWSFFFT